MKFKDKTRGGYPVEILKTDLPGRFPIAAFVNRGKHGNTINRYTENGRINAEFYHSDDLIPDIPEPRKIVRWFAGGIDPQKWGYGSPDQARFCAGDPTIKISKVIVEWTPEE